MKKIIAILGYLFMFIASLILFVFCQSNVTTITTIPHTFVKNTTTVHTTVPSTREDYSMHSTELMVEESIINNILLACKKNKFDSQELIKDNSGSVKISLKEKLPITMRFLEDIETFFEKDDYLRNYFDNYHFAIDKAKVQEVACLIIYSEMRLSDKDILSTNLLASQNIIFASIQKN